MINRMQISMFNGAKERAQQLIQENATTLLTAGGVVGTVATAVLAGRAGYKAAELIIAAEQDYMKNIIATTPLDQEIEVQIDILSKTDKVKLVGLQFAPAVLTGAATIGSIVMAHRMSASKAAALAAAYGLSEKQLREYKEKVQEKLTGPKAQSIDDELAQDRVNNTPEGGQIVIVEGEVLCFDQPTGRYFRGTMDKINKAVNSTNAEIIHYYHANASYFYEELELPPTTWTDEVGWNTDNLVELTISTVLSEDKKPCIAIDFRHLPLVDYVRNSYT